MSKTACISFGISEYQDQKLTSLPGAAADAKRVHDAFMNTEIMDADKDLSSFHLNLTKERIREVIADAAYNEDINALTIYFACHGESDASGYFLFPSDCQSNKLAFSAISLGDIFTILCSSPRKHVNLIIDACNAGGVAQDFSAIIKDPKMGAIAGISISIIALSGRNEFSLEYPNGGVGTTAFLEVLSGHSDPETNKEYLSLGDVAQTLDIIGTEQNSSYWSFNLMGAHCFCKNVYAINNRKAEIFSLPTINLNSSVDLSNEAIESIWNDLLTIGSDFNPRDIHNSLDYLLKDIENNSDAVSLVIGLFDSFIERARQNDDAFAPVLCCSIFLLIINERKQKSQEVDYFRNLLFDELKKALTDISSSLAKDEFFLVRDGGYVSFYTLPQRVSKIASWALISVQLDRHLNEEHSETLSICESILDSLKRDYQAAFQLISEKQGPAILIISALAKKYGFEEWGNYYIACLYHSFCFYRGKVAKIDLKNDLTYEFIRHRILPEVANYEKFCGRPTESLLALMSHYWRADDLDIIRYDFEGFDGLSLNAFIPEAYTHFSSERISTGSNLGMKIGFDVFTIDDLSNFITTYIQPSVEAALKMVDEQEQLFAIISSIIYPDRLPWFLAFKNYN